MSPRSTARFVRYTITSHPDSELRQSVRCAHEGCPWVVLPTGDQERASQAMLHHTATKGHALFFRVLEDMAVVTLADKAEQERRGRGQPAGVPAPWRSRRGRTGRIMRRGMDRS